MNTWPGPCGSAGGALTLITAERWNGRPGAARGHRARSAGTGREVDNEDGRLGRVLLMFSHDEVFLAGHVAQVRDNDT